MATEIDKLVVKIAADTRSLRLGLEKSQKQLSGFDKSLSQSRDRLNSWVSSAKIAAGVIGGVAVASAVKYSDTMTSISNSLKIVTKDSEELAAIQKTLIAASTETRSGLETTVDLYSKLSRSTGDLGLSQNRLVNLTKTITKSFKTSNASAQEVSGSIRQLGQAFASGVFRGDEFNSVAEQAPVILDAVSASLNKTKGEVRALAADGKLTAKVLIDAIEGYSDVIDANFNTATATFSDKVTEANKQALIFAGTNQGLKKATDLAGDALVFAASNLDVIAKALTVAGVATAVKFSAPLVIATARTTALGFASVATAGKVGILTAALNAAKGAMALLFSPVGIAIAATSVILSFADAEETAEEKTQKLTDKINHQTAAFKRLNAEQTRNKIKEVGETGVQAQFKIIALTEELQKLETQTQKKLERGGFLGFDLQFKKAKERAIELRAEIERLQGQVAISSAGQADLQGNLPELEAQEGKQAEQAAKEKAAQKAIEDGKIAAIIDANNQKKLMAENQANEIIKGLQRQSMTELQLLDDDLKMKQEKIAEAAQLKQIAGEDQLLVEQEAMALELQVLADHESKKTEIVKQQAEERKRAVLAAKLAEINSLQNFANSALQINSLFASKSKKSQKKQRKAEVAINTAGAVARAFAEHDFFTAIGISALVLANGKKQIDAINSEKLGGASGSGGGSPRSQSSGGGASQAQPQANRNISINMTGSGLFSTDQVRELIGQINEQVGDGTVITTG